MEYLDETAFTGPPPPSGKAQVLSVSTCLPGCCDSFDELWSLLFAGGETQTEVALDRWDLSLYYTIDPDAGAVGKTNAKHGAFLSSQNLWSFDCRYFGMKSSEANAMVPEQRLVLRTGATSLLEAGVTTKSIDTYVGDCTSESRNYVCALSPHFNQGTAAPVTASRLAYCFGLRGENCSFDTACSSSLVALGHAHSKLCLAKCAPTGALVIGVRVLLGPDGFVGLGAGGFLGVHGRCLTFDGSASGFGRGEGCSAAFLSLDTGEQDMDMHLCSLLGSAVNQDGRSASMTAPNGPSQQSCIRDSLAMAEISAESLSSMECHGTGTALGDPIEVGAVRGVVRGKRFPLLLTSSKSNLGHAEAAAGLNGFVKCVLILLHSACPANVHLRVLNGSLDTEGFPCFFGNELADVGLNSQHLGVSSFGFGGTNARADLWGFCQEGPRSLEPRLVTIPCPLCRRDMCKSCGQIADEHTLDYHHCVHERESQASIACCSECDVSQ
ncbi:Phenolphthiocerol/phthiocerol polyketide synthase subunit C ((Phenol)carboxyphthiodiolenone synthase subunit D) (Beta-ketoacyl-acyl-carrier-protein synthase I) (Phthiocerol synthesis polyketide synthase type I PpsD) [Durusdinium trenchii]|uniref:Ketosynthase family 3 (KS3) domain-containing protein n=1 Tax=Durusdinium trenchii TaxID=1381693 RepID=A0ABP0Q1K6_9DINO